jgi:hypothetical protein
VRDVVLCLIGGKIGSKIVNTADASGTNVSLATRSSTVSERLWSEIEPERLRNDGNARFRATVPARRLETAPSCPVSERKKFAIGSPYVSAVCLARLFVLRCRDRREPRPSEANTHAFLVLLRSTAQAVVLRFAPLERKYQIIRK